MTRNQFLAGITVFLFAAGMLVSIFAYNSRPSVPVVTTPVVGIIGTTTTSQAPVDLSGRWSSGTTNPKMIAEITPTTIKVNFVTDSGSLIYWNGTFAFPQGDENTVTSQQIEIRKAVMSRDTSKLFTYIDGKVSFDFTALGKTKVVELSHE